MTKKGFRYGFKAEANRWANDLRDDIDLLPHEPLCPWRLSDHLCVKIYNISDLPTSTEIEYLTSVKGRKEFSATVCFSGIKAFVINNDALPPKRQASNIAHELAHVVLRHPPNELFDQNGSRTFIKEMEDEAEWLGPALLVSEAAAVRAYGLIRSGKKTIKALSDEWNITANVIQMRINVVGAKKRYIRAA